MKLFPSKACMLIKNRLFRPLLRDERLCRCVSLDHLLHTHLTAVLLHNRKLHDLGLHNLRALARKALTGRHANMSRLQL